MTDKELQEAWDSEEPLTADDLRRIAAARARTLALVRRGVCIVCRGAGLIHPVTRERCIRCNGTGKEPRSD